MILTYPLVSTINAQLNFSALLAIMSVFEQLRPFVGFCQACGMFPYTMEQNLITNKFVKFTFSFSHLTTWWFFLIFLLQPVTMVAISYMSNDAPSRDLLARRDMPITVTILLAVTGISAIVELLLSRWLALQYRKLRNAIQIVQEVEKLFGEKLIATKDKNSITRQLVIGFILVVSMVSFKK